MATVEKRGDNYRITASAGYNADGKQIRKTIYRFPDLFYFQTMLPGLMSFFYWKAAISSLASSYPWSSSSF